LERKTASGILLTLLLIGALSLAFDIQPAKTEPTTKILVDPPDVTKNMGEIFSVRVNISDVTNLYGLEIQFWWDSTLLEYVSKSVRIPKNTYPDGVLWAPAMKVIDWVDKAAGTYRLVVASLAPALSFSGTGTVFIMSFKVLREAACYLHFAYTVLADKAGNPIDSEAADGKFSTPGAGLAPFASFTFEPEKIFVDKTTVAFDATASYDPDPSEFITVYMWDFGDGTKTDTTSPFIGHVFTKTAPAEYKVALKVKDERGSLGFPYVKSVLVQPYSDVKIEKVTVSPEAVPRGSNATINVTVSNIGITSPLPFNVTIYYNKTATEWTKIDEKRLETLLQGTTRTLTFNWAALATPGAYYRIMANTTYIDNDVDLNNNIGFSDTSVYILPIAATVNIDPDTLNLGSKGKWITAYIQLPEGYGAAEINATTILLNGTISPVLDPKYGFVTNSGEYLIDHNNDGILERMVKFDREQAIAMLGEGQATLTITGTVNSALFEGSDAINVVYPHGGFRDTSTE